MSFPDLLPIPTLVINLDPLAINSHGGLFSWWFVFFFHTLVTIITDDLSYNTFIITCLFHKSTCVCFLGTESSEPRMSLSGLP